MLESRYTPPLDEGYKALLKWPHVSYNSRLLNSTLALGFQGTFPSREQGGLGMYEQGLAFLHFMGKHTLCFAAPLKGATHLIATCSTGRFCLMAPLGTTGSSWRHSVIFF